MDLTDKQKLMLQEPQGFWLRPGDIDNCREAFKLRDAGLLTIDVLLPPATQEDGEAVDFCKATEAGRQAAQVYGMWRPATLTSYRDDGYPERPCDRCERDYRGPAVYCSLFCALEDA